MYSLYTFMYTSFTFNVNTVYWDSMIKLHSTMDTARKAYHHGELRESLLEAAEVLLEEDGPHGLSLRKVGRRLGVTPGAPYRHFEDKDALLGALAIRGFGRLRQRMTAGQDESLGGEERLKRAGHGYLEFASQHPELFRLMFGWIPSRDVPELCDAGDAAFADLRGILESCEREGLLARGVQEAGLMAWSAVHGAAFLLIDERLKIGDQAPCARGLIDHLHEGIWSGIGRR